MKREHDATATISALRRAMPYLRPYQGKVFVIKASGEVFGKPEIARTVLEQVGIFHQLGIKVVLVHGGGPQATRLSEQLGIEVKVVDGRRVTCDRTLEVATMVFNGQVNTQIVALCRQLGIPALGLSGVDAGLIRARRRAPKAPREGGDPIDFGYVGDIQGVNPAVVESTLAAGFVPIMSPLSADDEGQILNINADVVAAELAVALKAEKMILLTGVRGILERLDEPTSLVSYTDVTGLDGMIARGSVSGGMLPKIASIQDALRGGVRRVHVISYKLPDSLLIEVFTNEGSGTLVVRDVRELRPEELGSA